jgi:sec-independent protein translocase protein TatA
MFGGFGPWEVMLVFLVVLLLFGAKRIPEIAQGLGKGIREFKKATNEISDEMNIEHMLDDDVKKGEQDSQEKSDFAPPSGKV